MDNLQTMGIVNAMRTGDARVDMVRGSLSVVSFVNSKRCVCALETCSYLFSPLHPVSADDRHVNPPCHSTFV